MNDITQRITRNLNLITQEQFVVVAEKGMKRKKKLNFPESCRGENLLNRVCLLEIMNFFLSFPRRFKEFLR